MRKKRILIHSNYSRAFTGFGKNAKNVLRYLFDTDKYELMELANGKGWGEPDLALQPWKAHGSLPNMSKLSHLEQGERRSAGYGGLGIDRAIEEFRPDVYLGIEDIWAFEGFNLRPWWNKTTPIIWTTLDSMPLLDLATDMAPSLKHYYVWASFAQKALNDRGYPQVETLHGAVEVDHFYRKSDQERMELRKKFSLNNSFVVGFVFRNQLRKSVPNLLQGFKTFSQKHPEAKLLLHTSWEEGWDIEKLILEHDIDPKKILTTYVCSKCGEMLVIPFSGKKINCPYCKEKQSMATTGITNGVSEEQLNDVYNLMDVYCHPFTSGGQELPIQEAKLVELITLVTNYSCGEDSCSEASGGLPLEWSEYREPGTQFIKASTSPADIDKKLETVYQMTQDERKTIGAKARQFVLDNYSIGVIGKRLEQVFDACPFLNDETSMLEPVCDPDYAPDTSLSDKDFLIKIHKNCLNETIDENHTSFKIWEKIVKKDGREKVLKHFNNSAKSKLDKPKQLSEILDPDDKDKRIAVVVPQSSTDVLLINSLCENLAELYSGHELYVFTHPALFPFIEDSPFVKQCIAYQDEFCDFGALEGIGEHKGYFKCAFFPTTTTQDKICYVHNAANTHQFNLK